MAIGCSYPDLAERRSVFPILTTGSISLAKVSSPRWWSRGGSVLSIGKTGTRILRLGDRLRQAMAEKLNRYLSPVGAGLARGLLFGEYESLPEEVEDSFRAVGLMHLLAVSGLHLGIILAFIWFVLRLAGARPALAYPLVGLAVIAVLWIVGPRVSLVRASLLFAFLALGSVLADLGIILRRWVRSYQGLAAAALVVLACRPFALLDVGFQLSFGATAAIVVVLDPSFGVRAWVERVCGDVGMRAALARYLMYSLVVSAAAQAGTAPVIAYHFARIHPLVVIANLAAVPIAGAALWFGIVFLVVSAISVWAGQIAAGILGFAVRVLDLVVEGLATAPFSELAVEPWMGIWMGGLVVFLLLVAVYSRGSRPWTR